MTSTELREMVRDLESGRPVSPERVLRAVQFAADVAYAAQGFRTSKTMHATDLGAEVDRMAVKLHLEMVP